MLREKVDYKKKGPLGGAGPGKGGNLRLDRYLFFFFAFFFAAIIFPLLCWRFGPCAHYHNLWPRITLALYVLVFTSYVKKNLALKEFFENFLGISPSVRRGYSQRGYRFRLKESRRDSNEPSGLLPERRGSRPPRASFAQS
jgi:hypothetical protein